MAGVGVGSDGGANAEAGVRDVEAPAVENGELPELCGCGPNGLLDPVKKGDGEKAGVVERGGGGGAKALGARPNGED